MNIDKETGEIQEFAIRPTFLRTPFNYDTDVISNNTGMDCGPETRTQQQFKDEVDINTIVERFGVTGELPPTIEWPQQEEFMETFDYQTAMNVTVKAREAFMEMPANTRARFDNNPQKFMEFLGKAENQDEAIRLGIATRKEQPPQEPVKKEEEKKE